MPLNPVDFDDEEIVLAPEPAKEKPAIDFEDRWTQAKRHARESSKISLQEILAVLDYSAMVEEQSQRSLVQSSLRVDFHGDTMRRIVVLHAAMNLMTQIIDDEKAISKIIRETAERKKR